MPVAAPLLSTCSDAPAFFLILVISGHVKSKRYDLHQGPKHPLSDVQRHCWLQGAPLLSAQIMGVEGL